MNNKHIIHTLHFMQQRMSDCTLEDTQRMNNASWSAWRTRYNEAKQTVQMLRAILIADKAVN